MKETPKRSNEPVVWLLFGAGTTVSAIVFPILILIIGLLLPFGLIHNGVENIAIFASSFIGKLILLTILIFPVWGSMHRIHHGTHDFKIHIPAGGIIFYGLSVLYSVLAIFAVFNI
ncbi:succinate dehydrogenase subunit D [Bisgaardia hudsonensis]|uniref:Fumarate reductase subunit D n=1 Tax=Bisgaardia hudsonensis TaxID=109472 RepID=A0A4R2N385_9PAST|nr:fumarate reductase subunit FrdD [Bisgaardia hudsonensis]QLB12757.1 fumarate reductase [Bisgaardia hudsonensis]TCP14307.1 succinate dehydrogenase subunit D [Bisgaardia hudsonensis]